MSEKHYTVYYCQEHDKFRFVGADTRREIWVGGFMQIFKQMIPIKGSVKYKHRTRSETYTVLEGKCDRCKGGYNATN